MKVVDLVQSANSIANVLENIRINKKRESDVKHNGRMAYHSVLLCNHVADSVVYQ